MVSSHMESKKETKVNKAETNSNTEKKNVCQLGGGWGFGQSR